MWIEVIEIGLFCVCLYLAYLGCKQDLSASPMKNIPRLQKSNKSQTRATVPKQ